MKGLTGELLQGQLEMAMNIFRFDEKRFVCVTQE